MRNIPVVLAALLGLLAPVVPAHAADSILQVGVVGVGKARIRVSGDGVNRVVRGSSELALPAGRYHVKGLRVVRNGVRYEPRQRPYVIRTRTKRTTFVGFQYQPATQLPGRTSGRATIVGDRPPAGAQAQMLELVNRARAAGTTCGQTPAPPVPPLLYDAILADTARAHAQDMADNDFFGHVSADGRTFADRVRASRYAGYPGGENLAFDFDSPEQIVAAWLDSPGHCMNLMDREFVSVGFGFAQRDDPRYSAPTRYWVMDTGYPGGRTH